jgi:hypothetical protein
MRINYHTKSSNLSNAINYYPFGLVMEGDGMASAANNTEPHNNYQYNGKELLTETSLQMVLGSWNLVLDKKT